MSVKGQITLKAKSASEPVTAKIGSKVHEGDEITSGADSRAKIVMSDKNVFNLSPDSKIVIEKYRNDATEKTVEIKVNSGKLRSSLEQKYDGEKSQFNIKTPSAVAGVRGTDFVTSYNSQTHESNFLTFHGTVAVSAIGPAGQGSTQVMVKAGQSSSVKANQQPEAPKAIPQQQLQQLNHDTSATNNDSSTSKNKSAGSTNSSGGREPASISSSTGNSSAGTATPISPTTATASPTMLSNQDLSPDAARSIAATAPPASTGVGATPVTVLPTVPNNGSFLQNLSGATGSTHVNITLTPH